MLEITSRVFFFKKKSIWFAEHPFDVDGCDAVFFYACESKASDHGFLCEQAPTLIIDLTEHLDKIWKNMEQKSCRYFINRAKREGIVAKINQDLANFIELYKNFTKKKKIKLFKEEIEIMEKSYGTLFTAYHKDELIAGIYTIEDERHMRWFIGASKRLEADKKKATLIGCANRLLIWEAIKYAKEKGLKEFDFGGFYLGDKKDDPRYSINLFKKSFGGKLAIYYKCKKYYSNFYRLARGIIQKLE